MTDNHIHIGQFHDVYYLPHEITDIVLSAGMKSISVSTTTSCEDNIRYKVVEKEILSLLSGVQDSDDVIKPYFWYIPNYIKQKIKPETAFESIPYRGIKLHPLAHNWDFANISHAEALHGLFDFAAGRDLPVLIHTGHNNVDRADKFESFIREYSDVKFVLAHCRPLDVTLKMLREYDNAYCDTAFVSSESIRTIISAGYADRIIFGSDFPITHYYKTNYPQAGDNPNISLKEQYIEDIAGWDSFQIRGF